MVKSVDPNERIVVVPYDPTWAEEFARERERIAEVLGGDFVELEHIGSTSVVGLS
ncbi:MAG: GrpB family protein, partial [Tumebacillaceae bacterium]